MSWVHRTGVMPVGAMSGVVVMILGVMSAGAQQAAQPEAAAPTASPATGVVQTAVAPVATGAVVVAKMPGSGSTQTPLSESFDWGKPAQRVRQQRLEALSATEYAVQLRTMYMDRNKFDDSESEAWAVGGSAGLKTGYFHDFYSIGVTGYTSQKVVGEDDKDGTLMLKPGQKGYSVLGEAYGDVKLADDVHAYVGRKGYDTPYLNRNDSRMTPNTFEAATLQGKAKLGAGGSVLNYGGGYFSQIKKRNADEFVPMSECAGADVDRGVSTAGAAFKNGDFSFGAIDYYSEDIINIAYTEAKHALELVPDWKVKLSAQYTDQESTGDELLKGEDFTARQAGLKVDLPAGPATFTVAYTEASGDANMESPWSGYPGYTCVQVEDFNRDGEKAFMLKASYAFSVVPGLSAYGLYVGGSNPDDPAQYSKEEYNANVQWGAREGVLKGLALRTRYALVKQDGGDVDDLTDFRVICSYDVPL